MRVSLDDADEDLPVGDLVDEGLLDEGLQAPHELLFVLVEVHLLDTFVYVVEHVVLAVNSSKELDHYLEQLLGLLPNIGNGADLSPSGLHLLHPLLEEYAADVAQQPQSSLVDHELLGEYIVVAAVELDTQLQSQLPVLCLGQQVVHVVCPLLQPAPVDRVLGDQEDLFMLGVVRATHDCV